MIELPDAVRPGAAVIPKVEVCGAVQKTMEKVMSYLEELFGLSGKTAIVTGGAGVIGMTMSEALLKAGAGVAIWSRTQAFVESTLKGIRHDD